MVTNSDDDKDIVLRVPRWMLIVIGVLGLTAISAGALFLAKGQNSESSPALAISSSGSTTPATTSPDGAVGSPSSIDSIPEVPAQPLAPTQGSNRNSSSDSGTESAPPQTSPPQTSPPTTICAPNTDELQRLNSEYERSYLNYQKGVGVARYYQRDDDAVSLGYQHQANSGQYERALEELNNCRFAYWQFINIFYGSPTNNSL